MKFTHRRLAVIIAAFLSIGGPAAHAQDQVIATVNGKPITEADVKMADAEIGNDLGSLPDGTKRRVLVEFLIENQLFADAAERDKLGAGTSFDERMQYWRRRSLRELYFEKSINSAIDETEAKKFYDQQIGGLKQEEEVRARHILVESKDKAVELFEKIAHGSDFALLAKENSKDPGSKDQGGELGYFSRGQMVPQFEEAAFKLQRGEVSQPFETQFGWHIIRLDDRRERQPPAYDLVKERIRAAMIHQKAQQAAASLRKDAKIEYRDPEMAKSIESEKAQKK